MAPPKGTAPSVAVTRFRSTIQRGHSFVEYRLRTDAAELKERSGYAWRRFSEFEALLEALRNSGDEIGDAKLPSKWFRTTPEERQPRLERMVQALVDQLAVNGRLSNAPPQLIAFLGIGDLVERPVLGAPGAASSACLEAPPLPELYRERLDLTMAETLELAAALDTGSMEALGWRQLGTSGPFSWHSHVGGKKRMACGIVANSCVSMLQDSLFYSEEDFKKLEPDLDTVVTVARLGPQTEVTHCVMKSIMWLPPRDVIFVRTWRAYADGSVVHADLGLKEYPGVPPMDTLGRVRAFQQFGGTLIRPVPGQPTKTFVMFANDLDPRVSGVPSSVMGKINDMSASMLSGNLVNLAKLVKSKDLATALQDPLVRNLGAGATLAPGDELGRPAPDSPASQTAGELEGKAEPAALARRAYSPVDILRYLSGLLLVIALILALRPAPVEASS